MDILELRLKTHCISELLTFYREVLSWPIAEAEAGHFALQAGATRLIFEAEEGGLYRYHIAFNVPQNQFAEAKAWLQERVPLLPCGAGDEIHWAAWDAHAVYFLDAAGNVCEFIARHQLADDSDQPFSAASLRRVSEIGLATDDVAATCAQLCQQLGLEVWDAGDGQSFRALGDARGILIVVKSGRAWFPTADIAAFPQPVTLKLVGEQPKTFRPPQLPYQFEIVSSAVGK